MENLPTRGFEFIGSGLGVWELFCRKRKEKGGLPLQGTYLNPRQETTGPPIPPLTELSWRGGREGKMIRKKIRGKKCCFHTRTQRPPGFFLSRLLNSVRVYSEIIEIAISYILIFRLSIVPPLI
jgi:hypothetical protein